MFYLLSLDSRHINKSNTVHTSTCILLFYIRVNAILHTGILHMGIATQRQCLTKIRQLRNWLNHLPYLKHVVPFGSELLFRF